jgi:uncharacterized protein with PIN domain
MRFIADAMLGRLARWLRILGFDTLYCPDITDRRLLRLAREEGRFILTRDTHFLRKDVGDCLLVTSDGLEEQVSEVVKALGLRPPGESRCPNCNGVLREVLDKQDIADAVPEYVYLNFNRFQRCLQCGNVYWEGSQFRRIRQRVADLLAEGGN